jgi:L-threonylcarbamoyladenylate synthase
MEQFNTMIGKDIEAAKILLKNGLLVGVPTETVYGLAGNALSEDAALKIFEVKNRPHFDPLIVHTHSIAEIDKYTTKIPAKARFLMQQLMPGPLTLLLKKKLNIPDIITSGLDTVAIRIPNHLLTLQLLRELPFPLAAPSANPFGYISPTTAQHVFDQLHNKIPYILDGGPTLVGVESTIIGFEGDDAIVYRLGGVPVEAIESVIGKVVLNTNAVSNPQTPGMLKSHYAPRKQLIFDDAAALGKLIAGGERVGVIACNQYVDGLDRNIQILLSPKGDLNEAAKNLFAAMRKLDDGDTTVIYAARFADEGLGRAINDRLMRASVK